MKYPYFVTTVVVYFLLTYLLTERYMIFWHSALVEIIQYLM